MTTRPLTAPELCALAKLGKTEDLGDGAHHEIDFTIRVHGSLTQGEGGTRKGSVPKANLEALLVLCLDKLGGHSAGFIARLAEEAAAGEEDLVKRAAGVRDQADAVFARIKEAAAPIAVKGKLVAAVTFEVIDAAPTAKPSPPKARGKQ